MAAMQQSILLLIAVLLLSGTTAYQFQTRSQDVPCFTGMTHTLNRITFSNVAQSAVDWGNPVALYGTGLLLECAWSAACGGHTTHAASSQCICKRISGNVLAISLLVVSGCAASYNGCGPDRLCQSLTAALPGRAALMYAGHTSHSNASAALKLHTLHFCHAACENSTTLELYTPPPPPSPHRLPPLFGPHPLGAIYSHTLLPPPPPTSPPTPHTQTSSSPSTLSFATPIPTTTSHPQALLSWSCRTTTPPPLVLLHYLTTPVAFTALG
jgi:hypothetical protein